MKNIVLIKKEGQVSGMHITPSLMQRVNDHEELHLCWENCKNSCVFNCSKIADHKKRPISDYEYINSGFQVFDENGKMTQFKVTDCSNYEKTEKKRNLTKNERKHINALKEDLKTAYFDAENMSDAHVRQYMQMIRGELTGVKGKVLSEKAIVDKILTQPDAEPLLEEFLEYKEKEIAKAKDAGKYQKTIDYIKTTLMNVRNERLAKEYDEKKKIYQLIEKGIRENKITVR